MVDLLRGPLAEVLGTRSAAMIAKGLDLETVGDLLFYLPRAYADPGNLTPIADLELGENVAVVAEVQHLTSRTMRQRKGKIVEVRVSDETNSRLTLTFFAGNAGMAAMYERDLVPGTRGLFHGVVAEYRGARQLTNPGYELFDSDDDELLAAERASRPIAIYRAPAKLGSRRIARAVETALDAAETRPIADPLPADIRAKVKLTGLRRALELVHRPREPQDPHRGRTRLRFDEALTLQLILAQRRRAATGLNSVPRSRRPGDLPARLDERLPFDLTPGQQEIGAQIEADLARDHPMYRLLQGDVGSGKTVVALRAMLTVVASGGQAALLAPTEVLAEQHYATFLDLLGPLAERGRLFGDERGTRATLLTGSLPMARRREAMLDVASGAAGIVVGTHALLADKVSFAELALVVIDEQHRFGVEQRDALRAKGQAGTPHVLVMTATPIPRTVAMTVFGDLDTSTLREMPLGRRTTSTFVVPEELPRFVERTWQRMREEVDAGRQAFVVCPRIGDGPDDAPNGTLFELPGDEGEQTPVHSVIETYERLTQEPALAGISLGLMHGRLSVAERHETMAAFAAGTIDVLVSTTVIEVGVDVPNATAMVVLSAERFGLSQLHQLRGRIGRGGHEGIALLITASEDDSSGRRRLDALAATTDGFELARYDLAERREGNVLGDAQTGYRTSLDLLRVTAHEKLIVKAREVAAGLIADDPELRRHAGLAELVAARVARIDADYLEKG